MQVLRFIFNFMTFTKNDIIDGDIEELSKKYT